jgi:NitT/TauT family transport system permease protein
MTTSRQRGDAATRRGTAPGSVGYQIGRFLRSMIVPCLVLVAFVALWYLAVVAFDIKPYLLPTPLAVVQELSNSSDVLWSSLLVTAKEVIVGFLVSVIIAIPLGIALGELPALQRSLVPLLVIAQIIPKVALAPLMIVWFGLGIEAKVIFIVLLSFFPIIVNTMTGIASASVDFRKLAQSVGLGSFATLRKVTLPQALPSIFAGLKVAITLAVIGAVVAEFVASQSGLGFLILTAQGQVQTALLFAAILVLTVLGLLLYALISLIEWIVMPWNRRDQDAG